MKNKRYKRLAKRIKGHCFNRTASYCPSCNRRILCNRITINFYGTPAQVGIRQLENILKGDNL